MLPVECVVRGYITGSGWKDYQATGTVSAIALPPGLQESEQLPEPIFTPSTKAEAGHDEAIDFEGAVALIGDRGLTERVRDASLALYAFARDHARERGVILADTKFEFGLDDAGVLTVGDEVLTPDSSRFWPADGYEPGRGQPSFDKQYVRDWAAGTGGTSRRPRPPSPTTSSRAPASSTSRPTSASPASRSRPGWSAPRREGARPRPAQGGDPRPPGQAVERALPALGFDGVQNVHVGRLIELDVEDPQRLDDDVPEAAREPADRGLRDRPARTRPRGRRVRFGVVRFPGTCDDADALLAARRSATRSSSGTATTISAASTPS